MAETVISSSLIKQPYMSVDSCSVVYRNIMEIDYVGHHLRR